MKTTLFLLVTLVFSAFFVSSCTNDDVSPAKMEGSWYLQSYESEIKVTGKDPEKESQAVDSQNLFLDLNANGSFRTNSMFSAGEASTSGSEVSGTYEVKDGYLIMKYKDEDNVNVTFLIKVTSSSSNSLVLTMDKESLFKTAEAMITTDPEGAAAVQLALAFLEKISITFKYKKG